MEYAKSDADDDRELEAKIIARESPEGAAAHPEAGPRVIILLMAVAAFALLVIAFLLGLLVSPFAGIAALALAALLVLANPVFWASLSRARERRRIHNRVVDSETEAASHDEMGEGARSGAVHPSR